MALAGAVERGARADELGGEVVEGRARRAEGRRVDADLDAGERAAHLVTGRLEADVRAVQLLEHLAVALGVVHRQAEVHEELERVVVLEELHVHVRGERVGLAVGHGEDRVAVDLALPEQVADRRHELHALLHDDEGRERAGDVRGHGLVRERPDDLDLAALLDRAGVHRGRDGHGDVQLLLPGQRVLVVRVRRDEADDRVGRLVVDVGPVHDALEHRWPSPCRTDHLPLICDRARRAGSCRGCGPG